MATKTFLSFSYDLRNTKVGGKRSRRKPFFYFPAMDSGASFLLLLLLVSTIGHIRSESAIRLPSEEDIPGEYCESWRLAVETNNAGSWKRVPASCVGLVAEYMVGERYKRDSEVVGEYSSAFARRVALGGDGRDAWVFDIDETLLSNVPYYQAVGFGYVIIGFFLFALQPLDLNWFSHNTKGSPLFWCGTH